MNYLRGFSARLLIFVAGVVIIAWTSALAEKPTYGDLTDKEHCVQNLVMSLERQDIDGYDAILHTDFEFILVRGQRWNREDELRSVKSVFRTVSSITIKFGEGEWVRIEETNGAECPGCWETIRMMTYSVVPEDKEQKPETHDLKIRLVVIPTDDAGVTRYKLRVYQDLEFEPSDS